ncbi:MAG: hypothetical protein RBU25_00870 [Lentisphaeria bacterium]|jgi:hypothetical protein|nr:hypothetical protein [Lentisphaeria bacterium]
MNGMLKLRIPGREDPQPFMTAEQYRPFAEMFQEQVRPELDQQRLARIRSEDEARRHLIRH